MMRAEVRVDHTLILHDRPFGPGREAVFQGVRIFLGAFPRKNINYLILP